MADQADRQGSLAGPARNNTLNSVTSAFDPNEASQARQRRKREERRKRVQAARARVDVEVAKLLLENDDYL
jgi:hypothetical protein